MEKIRLVATTAFGIEAIAAKEIKDLGFENVVTENGRVIYDSDLEGIAKSNLWLRSPDRIYILLDSFKAKSFEELFNKINNIPWENYIEEDGKFPVNAKSVKSQLFSLSDIQSISKKAIVNRLSDYYKVKWFNETGNDFSIVVTILKDNASVLLDTSGDALHKRGYRARGNIAPLKETLAAALILISRWKPQIQLIDPMCGSGTLLIEAAMIGKNIAPGINRKFVSEHWKCISEDIYEKARKEAYDAIDNEKELSLEGYDIDPRAIRVAIENAELAGVKNCIHFQARDIKDFSTNKKHGYIIINPPYGERLGGTIDEVKELYKEMGEKFNPLTTWSKYIITSYEDFESEYGQKSTKNRKLYNGKIKTYYYQYYGERPKRKNKEILWQEKEKVE
ncbi:MAG: class I SAM-dependent RNA methyltransferase [Clostridiales bacterium]|nr:class I SAM-dependent RNA methyltransferase [Clostridiales bacterium]